MPRNYDNGKKKKKEKKRRRKLLLQQKLGFDGKRKPNIFARESVTEIDYKDVSLLKKLINDRGAILPARQTGAAKRQPEVTQAIKRARFMALLPYCPEKYI